MKTKYVLTLTALLLGINASAGPIFFVGTCGTFSNPSPNPLLTGTWLCPSAASLGASAPLADEFVVYNSDYSNGLASSVSTMTDWSFSGATFQFSTDTTTSTDASVANPAVSSAGLTLNPLTNLPPTVLAGFYNHATVFGTPTIMWSNQATVGSALQATGYAQVVYVEGAEPPSMLLLGFGLLGGSLYWRRMLLART